MLLLLLFLFPVRLLLQYIIAMITVAAVIFCYEYWDYHY